MAGVSAFRSHDARERYGQLYDAALAAGPVPVAESDIETSFGRTHILEAGPLSKPPLVALHGSSISSTMWVPLLPTLTATHRVTMIDAIDEAGKSIPNKPTPNSDAIVAWLDETLSALGIQRSAMVGASRGSWIATHYAMAFPDRVERLALVCPVGIVAGMRPSFAARALAALLFRPTEQRIESFLDSMVMPKNRPLLRHQPWAPIVEQFICGAVSFKQSPRNARPRLWPMGSDCDPQRLSSAGIPLLAIVPRHERFHDGPKTADQLRRRLPQARVELVDDANHMVFNDRPEIVEKLLADFLQPGG